MRQIVNTIKGKQGEQALPDPELVQCIWQGLISSIEWSARQDQNEALAIREITVRPIQPMIAHATKSYLAHPPRNSQTSSSPSATARRLK